MSTSIDNRIVGIQFDNKNFAKNVNSTMSNLDKLHQKLQFKGAQKGFSDVEKAASKCDLSNVSKAADTIQSRFSAMGIVGMNVLNRIADTAINTASRMLKAFTIAPITDGYKEYELKMGSVQTIMASTGESIGTVNSYLEELNRYSDRTIYSFADMTQNIGKFTNAGVSLNDAVKAIQGISNEAALSGANANEASRAMYNFSQALSSGAVKLIDWKSIENANMATKEFKQELINTAVAMGTLTKTNDGMYKSGKQVFNATKSFNDSLQTQWMTSEVLIETLGRYSDETTDIGKRAFAAAQDIKTYSQLVDTVKESIGSGWAQISELIIGDLEEAKEMWTAVGKTMDNAVSGFFDPITKFLSNNLDSNYKKWLHNGPIKDAAKFEKQYEDVVNNRWQTAKDQIAQNDMIIDSYEAATAEWTKYNQRVEEKVKNGGWFMNDQGQKQWWLPEPEEVKHSADEIANLRRENEELAKTFDETGYQARDLKTAMLGYYDDIADREKEYRKSGMSYEERLKALGLTREEFVEMMKMRRGLREGTVDVEALAESFNELSGRQKIVKGIGNSLRFVGQCLSPLKNAFKEVFFGGMDENWLGKFADRFYKFSLGLKVDSDTIAAVTKTFKGLFSGIRAVGTIASQVFRSVLKQMAPLKMVFEGFGIAIGHVVGYLGKLAESMADYVNSGEFMADAMKAWNYLATKFGEALNGLEESLRAIPELAPVIDFFEHFATALNDAIATGDPKEIARVFLDSFRKIGDGVKDLWHTIKMMDFKQIWNDISTSFGKFTGSLSTNLDKLKTKFKNLISIIDQKFNIDLGELAGAGLLGTLAIGMFKMVKSIGTISEAAVKLASSLTGVIKNFDKVLGSISKFISAKAWTERAKGFKIAAEGLIRVGIAVGLLAGSMWLIAKIPTDKVWAAAGMIVGLVTILSGIAIGASKFGGKEGAMSIASIAAGIVAIGLVVKLLSSIDFSGLDGKQIVGSLLYLGEALGAMYVIAHLANRLTKAGGGAAKAALSIIALSGAMVSVVYMMQKIASMDLSGVKSGLENLAIAFAGLASLMLLARLAGKNSAKGGLGILAISTALYLLVPMILLLSKLPAHVVKKSFKTIGAIALIFKTLISTTKFAGKYAHKAAAVILAMALALVPITGIVYILGHMDTGACIQGVAAIGVIMLAFSKLLEATPTVNASMKTVIAMGVIVVLLGAVVAGLALMDPLGVISAAGGLTLLILALTGMLMVLNKSQNTWSNIGMMAAQLGIMIATIGLLALIVGGLSTIQNPDTAVTMAIVLGALLAELTVILPVCAVVGNLAIAAIKGLGVLALAVVAMGTVVATFALIGSIDGAVEFLNRGIPVLAAIGQGIGQLVGNFIGGIGVGMMDSMIRMATKIGIFADDMTKASNKLTIDPGFSSGIKEIAAAVLALSAADLLQGIGRFLGAGDFSSLGPKLSNFGEGISGLAESIKSLSKGTVEKVKIAAEAGLIIADMSKAIPNSGGLLGALVGNNDMGQFASQFEAFGKGLSALSSAGAGIDVSNVKNVTKAGTDVANMAEAIPNMGGLLGDIVGNNNMADFKTDFEGFGKALAMLSAEGAGIRTTGIDNVVSAGTALANMASDIPNMGGKIAEIFGDNDMKTFGTQLQSFSWALRMAAYNGAYIESVEVFTRMKDATKNLADMAELVNGTDTTHFIEFRTAMDEFVEWFSGIVQGGPFADVTIGETLVTSLQTMVNAISNTAPQFQSASSSMMQAFRAGITSGTPTAIAAVQQLTSKCLNKLTEIKGRVTTAGIAFVAAFANAIRNASGQAESAASDVATKSINKLKETSKQAKTAGETFSNSFASGISSYAYLASNAASTMASDASAATDYSKSAYSSGEWFARGFANGIDDYAYLAKSAAYEMGSNAAASLNEGINSHSPSKLTMKSGKWFAQGFAIGIRNYGGLVDRTVSKMAYNSISVISDAIANINSIVASDVDIQPVIHPIVDMSDVERSARTISAMYNREQVTAISERRSRATSVETVAATAPTSSGINVNYTQNNYSPKPLSRIDIYRGTKNQLSMMKGIAGMT